MPWLQSWRRCRRSRRLTPSPCLFVSQSYPTLSDPADLRPPADGPCAFLPGPSPLAQSQSLDTAELDRLNEESHEEHRLCVNVWTPKLGTRHHMGE